LQGFVARTRVPSLGIAVAHKAPYMRLLILATCALLAMTAREAWAADVVGADDVCSPSATACTIDTQRTVADGAVLDFGERPLTIARRGNLDAGGGSMTIKAGTLIIATGGALFARGATSDLKSRAGSITIITTGGILVGSQARIDLSTGVGGGALEITAGGHVTLQGVIALQGTLADGTGGRLDIEAKGGGITLTTLGEIRALGGGLGVGGGDVTLTADRGSVELAGPIDASGRDGGSITIEASDSVRTLSGGKLDATANADFGDGGSVSITAGRDAALKHD